MVQCVFAVVVVVVVVGGGGGGGGCCFWHSDHFLPQPTPNPVIERWTVGLSMHLHTKVVGFPSEVWCQFRHHDAHLWRYRSPVNLTKKVGRT